MPAVFDAIAALLQQLFGITIALPGALDFANASDVPGLYQAINSALNTTSIGGILRETPSFWVNGLVDEVSLWRGVMSPEKIAELAAGSSPISLAGFRITEITRTADGDVSFTWNSSANRVYGVWASTDLAGPWIELDDSYASEGETTTFTLETGSDPDPGTEARIFFRVTR